MNGLLLNTYSPAASKPSYGSMSSTSSLLLQLIFHCITRVLYYNSTSLHNTILSCNALYYTDARADYKLNMPSWDYSGSAVVYDNFIRITEDRPALRGHLWSRKASMVLYGIVWYYIAYAPIRTLRLM